MDFFRSLRSIGGLLPVPEWPDISSAGGSRPPKELRVDIMLCIIIGSYLSLLLIQSFKNNIHLLSSVMDFFRSIFDRLWSTGGLLPAPERPDISSVNDSCTLEKLPVDVILRIVDFLAPESAALFALSCRPVYFTLGTKCFKELEGPQNPARYRFLELLEPCLPDHILCWECTGLHSINMAVMHGGRFGNTMPCSRSLISPIFSTAVFRMTMKRYHQKQDCSQLLALLKPISRTRWSWPQVEQIFAVPRIVAGSLYWRQQTIIRLPSIPFIIGFLIQSSAFITVEVCPHAVVCLVEYVRLTDYPLLTRARRRVEIRSQNKNSDRLRQCKSCNTEFQVNFIDLGIAGRAVCVTTWKDLGEGHGPRDPKWVRHTKNQSPDQPAGGSEVYFPPGSIVKAFEGKEHSMFQFYEHWTATDRIAFARTYPYKVIAGINDPRFLPGPFV